MVKGLTSELVEHYEKLALADYQAGLGKIFKVTELTGHADDGDPRSDGYFDVSLKQPAIVRLIDTDEEALKRWVYEWLDPYWDFELVEDHPELPKQIRTLWGYGPSYNALTGERQGAPEEVEYGAVVNYQI